MYRVGHVLPVVVVSILPHAEFKRDDHREDAPHYIIELVVGHHIPMLRYTF